VTPLDRRVAKLAAVEAVRAWRPKRVILLNEHEPSPADPDDPDVIIVRLIGVKPEPRI
jgi:hypothetical protein